MRILSLLIAICFITNGLAQTVQTSTASTLAESHQFDFWLGTWSLSYNDTSHASNWVTKDLDSNVIHEHFNDISQKYTGESWSVYNKNAKVWKQTWVDNQGGYIALTGKFTDGKMVLYTEPFTMADSTVRQNRMVYYNITSQSFDWRWEQTADNGKTWKVNWSIHYSRKM